jgi:hypothetical protein
LKDGRAYAVMAFEISESGMSAATINHLHVGNKVDLSPVDFKDLPLFRSMLDI